MAISRLIAFAIVSACLGFAYFVLAGEAIQHAPPPAVRVLHGLAAGALIITYLWLAPGRTDRIDRGVLISFLLFAAAGILSQFPRQSLDAVLAGLLYLSALFLARAMLADELGRRAFIATLMGLSLVITFITAASWLLPTLEWWSLTNWTVIPPLNMNLPAAPWGHRHDLALLLVMLYPSWWVGRRTALRSAVGTIVGILVFFAVLEDGSRSVWFAVAVASMTFLIPLLRRYWPRERDRQVAVVATVLILVAGAAVTGLLGAVAERITHSASVDTRWAMWSSLVEVWTQRPIAGYGPGSFAWLLQLTNYFDTNTLAPRHPDSALFQLLPEAGLLGVAAVIVLLAAVVPGVVRSGSHAAIFALTAFALAGLGGNPTDFGFLIAVAIGWVAYAVPRSLTSPSPTAKPHPLLRASIIACFGVIAVAWSATAYADVAYNAARADAASGRLGEAVAGLEVAVAFDPGMALYERQLGSAQLLTGDAPGAIASLTGATRLNPEDDLAWRALGLAFAASGDAEAGRAALERAVHIQRTDPTNLLLTARRQAAGGDDGASADTLAEVVQGWPTIVTAEGWDEFSGDSTGPLVDAALTRSLSGLPSPESDPLQRTTLAVIGGRTDLALEWAEKVIGPEFGAAYVAVMTCDPGAAASLALASDTERRSSIYWSLVARQSLLDGELDTTAARLFEIMTGATIFSGEPVPSLNPLDENGGGYSADQAGYRRIPIQWPTFQEMASPWNGIARWYAEPVEAIRDAGLDRGLETCT